MALDDIRNERIKKRERLEQSGVDVYPAHIERSHALREILEKFSALAHSKKPLHAAGRVMARREHGGSLFIDLFDGSGQLQAYLKRDTLGEEPYDRFLETADIGDFIGVQGVLFSTKKGEKTIEARAWTMLAKSLRPLPEKWHGLQDVEERFRKRYLDLLMNPDVRARFLTRTALIRAVRDFHEKRGFIEVETPVFHPVPGGALAKPFITHHHALNADFYLRIATELYLKRLIVAGIERVFEIGKDFRNEGIDPFHNPEFTMLECYAAYWDEEDMMRFVEDLFVSLAKKFGTKGKITFNGIEIAFKKPFTRISFRDALARHAQITDYDKETRDTLATRAKQFGIEIGMHESKGKIADEIYKKICRPRLVQPTFLIHHPYEISPLAKKRSGRPDEVRRFQLVVAGLEMTNAFAELNDPLDQRTRFEEQEKMREGGEEEAHPIDEDFIEALEYGMPPTAGLGIGMDRLVMLFTDTKNIKEVILFPTLKPKP